MSNSMIIVNTNTLVICAGVTIQTLIDDGAYDWIDPQISQLPAVINPGILKPGLYCMERSLESVEVEGEVRSEFARCGTLPELLAFGRACPEMQLEFPIAALGEPAKIGGGLVVPCLYAQKGKRWLYLAWYAGLWREDVRFLTFPSPMIR